MKGQHQEGTNILGLVVFATVLGVTLGKMREKGKPLLDFFSCLSEAMMIITNWVVWYEVNYVPCAV
jgi:Na+/H+-dicarboxylate symporter